MKAIWKKSSSIVAVLALSVSVLPLLNVGQASASFNKNMLITDSVFSNSSTMSAATIDSFLNTFPSSCISTNNKFSAIDPTGYNPTNGFLFSSGNVSAGRIIHDAAAAYDLNPQVILSTLQKEQSLVSGTAGCSTLRYVGAMGYGCPDSGTTHSYSGGNFYSINGVKTTSVSGTCVNTKDKAGFSQQVIRGAWLLKFGQQRSKGNVNWAIIRGSWNNSDDPDTCYGGPMTKGTFKRCKSDANPAIYDGFTVIDSQSVFMGSGGSAALYWYTPHLHGNQSFVNIYEGWFGSTIGLADVAHPDGALVKTLTSNAIYLLKGGQLWTFPNPQALYSYGYSFSQVKPATGPDEALTVAGSLPYREGSLVKGSGDTVYIIDDQSGTSIKRAFNSASVFTGLGYKFSDVQTVPDASLPSTTGTAVSTIATAHPDGTLVKASNSSTVYLIQAGSKKYFTSPAKLFSQGYDWSDVKAATSQDIALTTGNSVDFREGTLVKVSGPTVYVISDQGGTILKRAFANQATFVGLRYSTTEIFNISDSELPAGNGSNVGP